MRAGRSPAGPEAAAQGDVSVLPADSSSRVQGRGQSGERWGWGGPVGRWPQLSKEAVAVVWGGASAGEMEGHGQSAGTKQRSSEPDWKAVSDVEEGCSLCLAQGDSGYCNLTSAQPTNVVWPLGSPHPLWSALSQWGGQLGLAGLGRCLRPRLEGRTCLQLAGVWLSWLIHLPWASLTPAGLTPL